MIPTHLPDLSTWLPAQRWFSGKDRPIDTATVVDVVTVPEAHQWLVTVEVAYADGPDRERWLLALTSVRSGDPAAIGTVDGHPVADIAQHPEAAVSLLEVIRTGATLPATGGGAAVATRVGRAPHPAPTTHPIKPISVEQSNTSVVIGEEVVLKVIRLLQPGPNPEVELGTALTEAGFEGSPPLLGSIVGANEEAMVVVSRYIRGAGGAWELAVEEASGAADHGLIADLGNLGSLTATLHQTLREALPTEPASAAETQRWRDALGTDLATTRKMLANRVPGAGDKLRAAVRQALDSAPADLGTLQRVHGDYHLGQVLRGPDHRWWILDFEGEPGRNVTERRLLTNPARDVAGMLRSFDYARAHAVREGADPATAADWAGAARTAFLEGYGPDGQEWLRAFEVQKLLYEVRYEAANRPEWLPIPLAALGMGPSRRATRTAAVDPVPTPPSEAESTSVSDPAGPAPDPAPPAPATIGDAAALASGTLHDPHRMLGFHADGDRWVVRAWRPGADRVAYLPSPDGAPIECAQPVAGLFEARVDEQPQVGRYRLRVSYPAGGEYDLVDPYSFPPSLGEVDMHLLAEGRHEQAWTVMGANRLMREGIDGVAFAVWAPNATAVRVVGEFNSWDGRLHPMRTLGSSGIWELFLPDVPDGSRYKYELITADGATVTRADPWAKWAEVPPGTSSRVFTSTYEPSNPPPDLGDPHRSPMSVYELHLGSWRHEVTADGSSRPLGYRDLAVQLGDYLIEMGFTHVELLPVAEHPFGGSWGYQVTGQFAPTSRFGTPDDFRFLVDHLHGLGIGVIVDWVPAHFPKDEWALRRFDGTALYEHEDPRLGEHPDWGTMVFNYGRKEVRNFIVASALYWVESMGIDGLRVDAVASMLYLDYSRKEGEWLPNEHGGRENLAAVDLLQEVNATVYKRNPHAVTIAEESTAWPGVSRPTHLGGLGFGFKWNMGWMHDTLAYFARDPIYRRWHHNQLTFGLMYAFSEQFVLPLSHDEVVHGKGSLINKMPGDDWQQFANLRALLGWMWGHPGKSLLFMGAEFGQRREWSEERSLDWHLVEEEHGEVNRHRGLQRMVADMNAAYRSLPALWRRDSDPEGFSWIDANNADDNLLSFVRHGDDRDFDVAVIANLSPTPQHDIRIGLPAAGHWEEVLNTDAELYGGSNVGNLGGVVASDRPWHGMPASAEVSCPPLGVVWLRSSRI